MLRKKIKHFFVPFTQNHIIQAIVYNDNKLFEDALADAENIDADKVISSCIYHERIHFIEKCLAKKYKILPSHIEKALVHASTNVFKFIWAHFQYDSFEYDKLFVEMASRGRLDVIKYIIKDQDSQFSIRNALVAAIQNRHWDIASFFINKGVFLKGLRDYMDTPILHLIITKLDLLEQLLRLGCDVNEVDRLGNTALMEACFQSNFEAVALLLIAGVILHRNRTISFAH